MKKIMNSKLPAKQRNGIFYKILLKIKQIFRRKKYEEENLESNKVIVNSNNQFKNDIKIDIENIEFNLDILLGNVVNIVAIKASEKNIDFVIVSFPSLKRASSIFFSLL